MQVTVPISIPQWLLAYNAKQYFNLLLSTEETILHVYLFNVLFIFPNLFSSAWDASLSLTDSLDWTNVEINILRYYAGECSLSSVNKCTGKICWKKKKKKVKYKQYK